MKKCVYCGKEVSEESVIDVCGTCGVSVWGDKMFQAILENMTDARDRGTLFQG